MELSQTFDHYQEQFLAKCEQLKELDLKSLDVSNKDCYRRAQVLVQQLLVLQKRIDIELCCLPGAQKDVLLTKFKPLKKMIHNKKVQLSEMAHPPEVSEDNDEQSHKLLSTNDKLAESKRLLYSTQAMSDQIVTNLQSQSQKLQGQVGKLKEVRNLLSEGSQILDRIWIKQKKYKLIMYLLFAVLGGLFLYSLI